MSIVERVMQLQLPAGEFVVIGSGLLDAWGLRESSDIDLVVSDSLYEKLRASEMYKVGEKYGEELLEAEDIEVWKDWKADAPFDVLKQSAVKVEGIQFVHPDILIKRKSERNSPKDIEDIRLIREYLAR